MYPGGRISRHDGKMLQVFNGSENMNKMRRKWKIEKDPNMSSREENALEWDL